MAKSTKLASAINTIPDSAEKFADKPRPATPGQRYQYVEVAAYYIAERRGFDAGSAAEDWAQAELEIDRLLAERHRNH